MNASCQHTDGIETTGDTTRIIRDETPQTLAQKLAQANYAPPTLGHYCRGCDVELLPGQPCGARCQLCAAEDGSLALQERPDHNAELGAFVVGLVTGIILLAAWLKIAGVIP